MLFCQLKEKIGIKKFLHTIFFIPGTLPILNKLTEYHFIRFSISFFRHFIQIVLDCIYAAGHAEQIPCKRRINVNARDVSNHQKANHRQI
jgi:hypothetical protein